MCFFLYLRNSLLIKRNMTMQILLSAVNNHTNFKACVFLIGIICLSCACSKRIDDDYMTIQKVKRLMYTQPDSATALLEKIPNAVFDSLEMSEEDYEDLCLFRADQSLRRQRYDEALCWLNRVITIKRKNSEQEQALMDRMNRKVPVETFLTPYYIGVLGVLLVLLWSAILYDRKSGRMVSLSSSMDAKENEITFLSHQLRRVQECTNEHLGCGKKWYDRLLQGGTMKNISIEEEQHFVDYYSVAFPDRFERITSPYRLLSLRHTTYQILSDMGFSDKEIMRILFVKASTIRNYRLRMNKNKK